jgi:hypothetical protein
MPWGQRLPFLLLSTAYIAMIFLFAGSEAVSDLAIFNPLSLLHIPLYGILTGLLFFSFFPVKIFWQRIQNRRINSGEPLPAEPKKLFLISFVTGMIACAVAISDEYHQSFIPTRDGSAGDVLLDMVGISLSLLIILRCIRHTAPR